MSGGHWGYKDEAFRAMGDQVSDIFDVLAQIEHELDWGISGDTCLGCVKRRSAEALIRLFDGDYDAAKAIARDREQNQCSRCLNT